MRKSIHSIIGSLKSHCKRVSGEARIFILDRLTSNRVIILFIVLTSFCVWQMLLLSSLVIFPLPDVLDNDYSELYLYDDGRPAWITLNSRGQYRLLMDYENLSTYCREGIIWYEDRFFYLHPGFNPVSIVRAIIINSRSGRVVSGGSTITMQLARLAEPKARTIAGKCVELFRALQIETRYSKHQILAMYLSLLPMGGNIEGIGSAGYLYFGKSPAELTYAESCMLIGLSNSPTKNRPDLHPANARMQRNKVAARLAGRFSITERELDSIKSQPLPERRLTFSNDIIPLVLRFRNYPWKPFRRLAINRQLQKRALSALREQTEQEGVANGAVIIVDNSSGRIISYIGSPDYGKAGNGARYNAANTPRSPGSTLKPFIYALGIDNGLITPRIRLFDIPMDYHGYKPENYYNAFMGPVSCTDALTMSLNIPAVTLEQQLDGDGLGALLYSLGIIRNRQGLEDHSLSIALGSLPITLEQVTALYTSLASGGEYRDLDFFWIARLCRMAGDWSVSNQPG
jgi:penicillin-binding protein 1C